MGKTPIRLSSLAAALLIAATPILLAGCDKQKSYTVEERLDRAREARSQGELRSAILEMKNALKENPNSSAARYLLGQLYIDMEDGGAAEKELTLAKSLGVDEEAIIVPLSEAWIIQGEYEKVLEKVAISVNLPPATQAALRIVHGDAYRGLGRLGDALTSYKMAADLDPNNPLSLVGQANVALAQRDIEGAKANLAKAAAIDANNFKVITLMGDIPSAQGDFKSAIEHYKKLVKARPENLFYRTVLAWAQTNTGDFKAATKNIDRVRAILPDYPPANHIKAVIAFKQKDYRAAKEFAERTLSVDSNHMAALLIQGASAYTLGQIEQANASLTRYLAAVPQDRAARKMMASIQMALGRADDAYNTLKMIANEESASKDPDLLNMIARAALQKGDYESGRRYLEDALAAEPESATTMARLGIAEISSGNVEKGLDELKKAVSLDPKSIDKRALLVLQLLRAKRTDEALAQARDLQKEQPKRAVGHTLVGVILAIKGDDAGARKQFHEALAREPGNSSASFNLVRYATLDKNWQEVRRLLAGVLKKEPNNQRALLLLADLERQQGDDQESLTLLQKAAELKPEAREPAILLAQAYLARGDSMNAIATARKVAPIYPQDKALLELIGKAEMAAGQPDNAVVTFDKLAELAPADPQAHYLLASAHEQQGNWVAAERTLAKVLNLAPRSARARIAMVRAKASLGKFAEAEQLLKALIAEKPKELDVGDLEAARGVIAAARQDYKSAVVAFAAAYKTQENSINLRRLAEAEIRGGNAAAGLKRLETWLAKYPKDHETRFFLANQLLAMGRLNDADSSFQLVVNANPKNAVALNNLAWVKLQQKDAAASVGYIERALKADPENPEIYDTAGVIYMAMKRYRDAVGAYRKAADLNPTSAALKESYANALVADNRKAEAREVLRELLDGPYQLSDRGRINQRYLQLSE